MLPRDPVDIDELNYDISSSKYTDAVERYIETDDYKDAVEEEMIKSMFHNRNMFWEAAGPDGLWYAYGSSRQATDAISATEEQMINYIAAKNDQALGKIFREIIENYFRASSEELVINKWDYKSWLCNESDQ